MEADRAYFDSNPAAGAYVRDVLPGEHPFACVWVQRIEVLQLAPGVRQRREAAAVGAPS